MARILRCRPSTIAFTPTPVFADPETEVAIRQAAAHVRTATLPLVLPTETVYGLGASALSAAAVAQIFAVKGRPADNPLIVHISSVDMLRRIVPDGYTPSRVQALLMDQFWPGPLTMLLPVKTSSVPSVVTAGLSTVAIRMPSHSVARALIALADTPLAAPSANTSGRPSPTTAEHVQRDLGHRANLILDGGPCSVGVESTVVDCLSEPTVIKVLRPGGVSVEDIHACLQNNSLLDIHIRVHRRDYDDTQLEAHPSTPGMKYQHYSPSRPVLLLLRGAAPAGLHLNTLRDLVVTLLRQGKDRARGLLVGLMVADDSDLVDVPLIPGVTWRLFLMGPKKDLSVIASRIFAGLLSLEQQGVDYTLVEGVGEKREGLAVMNRLRKASTSQYWIP